MRIGELGELGLIERVRAGVGQRTPDGRRGAVRVGIGDDCAVLRVPRGSEVCVTTDLLIEGRHFRRDWHSAESAGHRCLARGLSDLAAMGARPLAAFLSVALPPTLELSWFDDFLRGLRALAGRCHVSLAGGDTSEAPSEAVVADIVLLGAVRRGRALLRRGARPGDWVYVTGSLGGSAVELRQMAAGTPCRAAAAGGRQSFPEPRLAVGQALVRRGWAHAAIDLSDGLSTDLLHVCRQSGVRAELHSAQLPLANGAALEDALHGGEDYELLFTAPAAARVPGQLAGVPVTEVGRIVPGEGVWLDGLRLERGGWEHLTARQGGRWGLGLSRKGRSDDAGRNQAGPFHADSGSAG